MPTPTDQWLLTTSLGDRRDPCARLYITSDPGDIRQWFTECVVVPPDEPLNFIGNSDLDPPPNDDDTAVLFGVARRDVTSVEAVADGTASPVDLIESPADLGYRFFAAPVGADDTVVLRAYGDAGQLLGEIERPAP